MDPSTTETNCDNDNDASHAQYCYAFEEEEFDPCKDEYFPGLLFEKSEDLSCPTVQVGSNETFQQAWDELINIAATEIRAARSKRVKRKKKSDYDAIIRGLKIRSDYIGFSNEELLVIWKVATHANINLNCTQRRNLILIMCPRIKVNGKVINAIAFWLKSAHSKGFKQSVMVGVYQLLNLYVEYRLLEENGMMNETILTQVLAAPTEIFVIPWKMRLLRNIFTPNVVSGHHINELYKLLKFEGAKKTHLDDINAAIGVCRMMRPDLFATEEPILFKIRNLNFPNDVSSQFHRCKLRIQRETAGKFHPMANRIFPEFLPEFKTVGRYVKKNVLETMLEKLETNTGVAGIVVQQELLQVFQEWIQPMLHYRFHNFSGFISNDDYRRYCFMFDRCSRITSALGVGLPVLNNWVCTLLGTWDFWIFDQFINQLITHLPAQTVLQKKESMRKMIVGRFSQCPWLRLNIWEMMVRLYNGWIQDIESNAKALEWLLDIMGVCVTSLVKMYESGDDDESGNALYSICLFYLKMLKDSPTMDIPIRLNEKMNSIPGALVTAVYMTEDVKCMEVLKELIYLRSGTFRMNKIMDDHALALSHVLVGNWSPCLNALCGDAELPLKYEEMTDVKNEQMDDISQAWFCNIDEEPMGDGNTTDGFNEYE